MDYTGNAIAYEDRFCILVDILGFKDLVHDSVADPTQFQSIQHALSSLRETGRVAGISLPFDDRRATLFSDHILLSARHPSRVGGHEFNSLVWLVYRLAKELASCGIFLRGSFVTGLLVHTQDTAFGPALVAAHQLESEIANHMRVVVDAVLVDRFVNANATEDDSRFVADVLREDYDGKWFIDYINLQRQFPQGTLDGHRSYIYLRQLEHAIVAGLGHRCDKVRAKYKWLARRHRESRDGWLALGPSQVAEYDLERFRSLKEFDE